MKLPLSVAIITLNEEVLLPDCLKSVGFADEIIVVDSGSTDQTLTIAQQCGARIFLEKWRGFGPQKQFAIDQCRNSWVLVLDADERIPPETAQEISSLFVKTIDCQAYSFPRLSYFSGRLIRHGGWGKDRVVRLFNKENCRMSSRLVHEAIEVQGNVGNIKNVIHHYTRQSLHQTIEKINQYSTIGAQELYNKGKKATIIKAVLNAFWTFLHSYFFRLGFLDRSPGLIIAVSDAVYTFFKYTKLIELHENKNK